MFEDSTFESRGTIPTRSRNWMMATFALNAAVVLALILIPLFHPEALPRLAMAMLMATPPPSVTPPKSIVRPEHATVVPTEIPNGSLVAPPTIPKGWKVPAGPEVVVGPAWIAMGPEGNGGGSPDSVFRGTAPRPTIVQTPKATAHISQGVAQGLLVHRVVPDYPAVPRAAHIGGTVVLQATISKNGTIENLRAVSGPEMLRQAALDAVQQWRYRPYLLNGEPVEVETTVNVDFTLQ